MMDSELNNQIDNEIIAQDLRRSKFPSLMNKGELLSTRLIPWSIDFWIPRKGVTMIYGQSNAGKTYQILDSAFHTACGFRWHGCDVGKGVVLYCPSEGTELVGHRIKALVENKTELADGLKNFEVYEDKLDFSNPNQIKKFKEEIGDLGASRVIIDTLSGSIGLYDDLKNADMHKVLNSFYDLSNTFDASIEFTHHPRKDDGTVYRGASVLYNDVDVVIMMENRYNLNNGEVVTALNCTKNRYCDYTKYCKEYTFKRIEVEVGKDQKGNPITDCYIEKTDIVLSENDQEVYDHIYLNRDDEKECTTKAISIETGLSKSEVSRSTKALLTKYKMIGVQQSTNVGKSRKYWYVKNPNI